MNPMRQLALRHTIPAPRTTPHVAKKTIGGPAMLVMLAGVAIWQILSMCAFAPTVFPSPVSVVVAFREEIASGRLADDIVASLYRVIVGFGLAIIAGVPAGIGLGHSAFARGALLPAVNFFRALSPLAWIPFAILWFGIGDMPAIFLIFMSTFFSITLTAMAAVANVPKVYFRVADDYGFSGAEMLFKVTLPAIMPQLLTGLRVTAGVAWLVVVAAEMVAGRDGLGFLIWDARNGLRTDLLVCGMITIGIVGIGIDAALSRLTKFPSVRWGYER
jgi:NitT/TauT family transport system permease protein